MKNIAKITAILLLSLVLATPTHALRSSVYFLGQADQFVFHPGTSWSDTDLFDNFEGLMPGDTRTEEISVRNASNDCDYVKIYLKAETVDDSTMADFLSQLRMVVKNGDQVIYQASPDQTAGLSEYTLLGTYNPGDASTLDVILEAPITLGNEYMHQTGEVNWTFMAECYADGEIVEPDNPVNPDNPDGPLPPPNPNPSGPQTFDHIVQYFGLFLASALGLIIVIALIRKFKQEETKA